MEEQQNNKELGLVDILQVFGQWIVSGLNKLVDWGMFLLFFAFKQWKVLAVAILALAIYSYAAFRGQDAQYEARMIVRSNALETSQMKSFFDNYATLINNEILPDEKIKSKTGLSHAQCNDIVSLKTFFCIDDDRDGVMDEIDLNGKIKASADNLDSLNLCVKVVFADVNVLDDVKESLMVYLNNTPYVVEMNTARKALQLKRREYVLNELKLFNTMQERAYGDSDEAKSLVRSGGVVVDNRRILEVYEDKDVLWKRYEALEKEINTFKEPITIVEDFVIEQRALNTFTSMLKKNILIGGLIIYFLLLIARYVRKEKDKYLVKI